MKLEPLLAKAAADESAFKLLYEFTADKVFRYFLARTGGRQESLDLMQNTYAELWKGLRRFTYQSDEQFYGYLFTIARRMMIKSWRLHKTSAPLELAEGIIAEGEGREDYRALFAGVDTLAQKQRLVIRLRYFSDFSFAEIALALGTTENNAKVLHHRALQALQSMKQFYA
jgi:RNA polymerase sigma factor (sigma-70 family)